MNVTGYYLGVTGLLTSLVGVSLTVYSMNSSEVSIFLGVSGWLAAIICSLSLSRLCLHLIRINTTINERLITLSSRNEELKYANDKLLEIDAYVISKALHEAAPRASNPAYRNRPISEATEHEVE